MEPRIWGNYVWYLIHVATFTYVQSLNDKEPYDKLFDSLKYLMACQKCKMAYRNEIERNKPNYDNLKQWSIDFHNNVNGRLRKKKLNNEEVQKIYYPSNDGKLEIKYDKIDWVINHFITTSNDPQRCKELIIAIIKALHPCSYWRNKGQFVLGIHQIDNVRTVGELKQWYEKFKNFMEEYDKMEMFHLI